MSAIEDARLPGPSVFAPLEIDAVRVLLCDADGNLFPSEEPAFDASAGVTNRLLADFGVARRYPPDELRRFALGRTFRATVLELARTLDIPLDATLAAGLPGDGGARRPADGYGPVLTAAELERRVAEERKVGTAHLGAVLAPDPQVHAPLAALGARFGLAVVSSSALARLDVCFAATGLDVLFPPDVRYSAEDSLPRPASKPDPAVYRVAGQRLGITGPEGLAIEDAVAGVRSAVGAGFQVVGNLQFVAPEERAERAELLRAAGASACVDSWAQFGELVRSGGVPPALRT